jgi:hypothetical protein
LNPVIERMRADPRRILQVRKELHLVILNVGHASRRRPAGAPLLADL